jgi:hypothetical protein
MLLARLVATGMEFTAHDGPANDEGVEAQPRCAEKCTDEVFVERKCGPPHVLPLDFVTITVPFAESADQVREVTASLPRHEQRAEPVTRRAESVDAR